jgi:tRNA (guanine37-N1)-methyltransferase
MRLDIVTLFPEMIEGAVSHSILKRACDAGLVDIRAVDLRPYGQGRHRITDDTPAGGGGGMLMKVDPIADALAALAADGELGRVILTDPRGRLFTQSVARELAAVPRVVFICGHYEGVDERVRSGLATDTLSIGDFVLTGGELPALVMADAIVRLLPGVLGAEDAPERDSFAEPLLEYPQYTRPREHHGRAMPDILLTGDHARIERWRRWHQLHTTREQRPDLWAQFEPGPEDLRLLDAGEPDAAPSALGDTK